MFANKSESLDFVRSHFSNIWPAHLTGFTTLLIELRRHFDGDLDMMLVLAVVGARTRPEHWQPEPVTYRDITQRPGNAQQQLPINIQSISDYTGIPRETVRRKIAQLIEKGWIDRATDGRLTIARAASEDLEQSTMDSMEYLATISAAVLAAKSGGDRKAKR